MRLFGRPIHFVICLVFVFLFVCPILFSINSFADDVTDDVVISLPVSCTISGTGMDSHNTTLRNGNYEQNIGTTTTRVYCNDYSGFSIYAAGFTGDVVGEQNSNKLVGTSYSDYATIPTGTNTGPVGGEDVSSWAMKLATDFGATYPLTITTDVNGSFSNYHIVPNEFTKVVTRFASTDVGANAVGSTFTSTYAVYASRMQAPDTYSGQVLYSLVHPNTAPEPLPPVSCQNNEPCIGVLTSSSKLNYQENETIYPSDLTVYLYNADGTVDRQLSNNEFSIYPTIASSEPTITASEGVQISNQDTYLGRVIDRQFYKAYDGAAIGYFRNGTSAFAYWMGPVTIALSPEAAQQRVVSGQSVNYSPTESFQYHGITLYACHWYAYQTTNGESPLPVLEPSPTSSTWADTAEDLGIVVSSNVITVTFVDPDSGKIMQDSFTINVND